MNLKEASIASVLDSAYQKGRREVVEKLKKKDRYMETDKSMLLLDAEYIKVTMRELKEWGIDG